MFRVIFWFLFAHNIIVMLVEGVSKPPITCAMKLSSLFGDHNATTFSVKDSIPSDYSMSYVCQFPLISATTTFVSMQSSQVQKGSLHAAVYNSNLKSIGQLHSNNTNSARSFGCMSSSSTVPKFLRVSGTPNLKFIMTVSFVHQPMNVHYEGNNSYMQFNNSQLLYILPSPTSPSAQLDIAVKSDSKGEGVLRVSRYCEQAMKSGEIHDKKPALFLTFEKRGLITISKVSRPAFSTSEPLYVFVSVPERKTYSIEVKTSFGYNYLPILWITLISVIGGLDVTFLALCSFFDVLKIKLQTVKMLFKYWRHVNELRPFSYTTYIVGCVLVVGGLQFAHLRWETMIETGNRDRCFYNDLCYRVSPWHDLPLNLMMSNIPYVVHGLMLALALFGMELHFIYKARADALRECGAMGSVQARIRGNIQRQLHQERLPQHALECSDLNLHLPELTMPPLHGDHNRLVELTTYAYKRKYNFSIGYAFAWALVFEGVFSTVYHLCPSRATFQLDTAFMFVICGMIIVSLFNGLSDVVGSHDRKPIGNNNFFLAVIVPLYLFNYLGFVYNEFKRSSSFDVAFIALLVIWFIAMTVWSFYKLAIFKSFKCEDFKLDLFKIIVFLIAIGANVLILSFMRHDFSQAFLFSSIFTAIISVVAKCEKNVIKCLTFIVKCLTCPCFCIIKCICYFCCPEECHCDLPEFEEERHRDQGRLPKIIWALRFIYVLALAVLIFSALYVFEDLATTQKTDTPAQSRNLNKECVWISFFDWHDIWHLLSSFALLMGVFPLMYISK